MAKVTEVIGLQGLNTCGTCTCGEKHNSAEAVRPARKYIFETGQMGCSDEGFKTRRHLLSWFPSAPRIRRQTLNARITWDGGVAKLSESDFLMDPRVRAFHPCTSSLHCSTNLH